MPNDWFEFKQFKILQDRCAMKVGTDGVLLGAWAALPVQGGVLDIGTGTGLIALMMAQRNAQIRIDAIEIDLEAARQAAGNVAESPWASRIRVEHCSFQNFLETAPCRYDLIISNPPFFSFSVKAGNDKRTLARHTETLSFDTMLAGSMQLLSPGGTLALILPVAEFDLFSEKAKVFGFFEQRRLTVYPTLEKPAVRILSQWALHVIDAVELGDLVVEPQLRHHYSPEYKSLTKDFYLKW
jgi:tRNA1Val (adenine37-N6)-methyltransferase